MENVQFKLVATYGGVIFHKNGDSFSLTKTSDGDMWFSTSKPNLEMTINFSSTDYHEWKTYELFENFFRDIVGRFVLDGDECGKFPISCPDFIDLDNKTIIWHSDSGINNILRMQYDQSTIIVSILKDKCAGEHITNTVRIRVDGSEYGTYYQQFGRFFDEVCRFEESIKPKVDEELIQAPQKKKSFLDRFHKGKK